MDWRDVAGPALIALGIVALVWFVLWLAGRNASVCTCDESDDCTCGGAWGEKR